MGRKFTEEMKVEAIKLVVEHGVSKVQAASDLGVGVSTYSLAQKSCVLSILIPSSVNLLHSSKQTVTLTTVQDKLKTKKFLPQKHRSAEYH